MTDDARQPFIIDAGPALNFLASGNQRLLSKAIGGQAVHAPESVETEVLRKANNTTKFKGAASRWRNMKPTWLTVLSDDSQNESLRDAAQALLPTSLEVRQKSGDDLGETMVVLHAYAMAMAGEHVVVIIDDRKGRTFASKAIQLVKIANAAGLTTGRVSLTSTTSLIGGLINTADIPDLTALKRIWGQIAAMDDGLPNDVPEVLRDSPRWPPPDDAADSRAPRSQ